MRDLAYNVFAGIGMAFVMALIGLAAYQAIKEIADRRYMRKTEREWEQMHICIADKLHGTNVKGDQQ